MPPSNEAGVGPESSRAKHKQGAKSRGDVEEEMSDELNCLQSMMSAVTLSDDIQESTSDDTPAVEEGCMSHELDSLRDMMTAVTLTDDGPDVQSQPSKLWTSRQELQHLGASEHPDAVGPISQSDALNSVKRVRNSFRTHFLSKAKKLVETSSPPSTSSTHSLTRPPTIPWQKQALPRKPIVHDPRVRSSIRNALPSMKSKAVLEIIHKVEEEARSLHTSLFPPDGPRSLNDASASASLSLRSQLREASSQIAALHRSLDRAQQHNDPAVQTRKQAVSQLLENLTMKITLCESVIPSETDPVAFNSSHVFKNPVAHLDVTAQLVILLGVICNVILGIATDPCNFIISAVLLIIDSVMAVRKTTKEDGSEEWHADDESIRTQLPKSLYAALNQLSIESEITVYAICPNSKCHFPHRPTYDARNRLSYPSECTNSRLEKDRSTKCCTPLLKAVGGDPIKPFLVPSFPDFLARELADETTEAMFLKACDDAFASLHEPGDTGDMTSVFQAQFMKSFTGPNDGKLFIERDGKVRLAFAMQVDFFNPNGTRKRGNHDSIGIISLANLNLPETLRYKPEHLFLMIIPGPKEPDVDCISNYMKPIVDEFLTGWERGIHISRTASCPDGRIVEPAIVLSVNDLPAARKAGGLASHASNFICSVCKLFGRACVTRTDPQNWQKRDPKALRRQAEAYRDAGSESEREKLFKRNGVRWSELWRLPYWDPTRMLVIDSMHCFLEGLVHWHCRHILLFNTKTAAKKEHVDLLPAFDFTWPEYDCMSYNAQFPEKTPDRYILKDDDGEQVARIQKILQLPIETGELLSLDQDDIAKRLGKNRFAPLRYVCYSLEIPLSNNLYKAQFIDLLLKWRRRMPSKAVDQVVPIPRPVTTDTIEHVHNVIRETSTPSWINSVPYNYGDANAGTIKADEWRTLATVYLPIALIVLWGEDNGRTPDPSSRFLKILDHTMALFQAADILCRYTMTLTRATAFRELLKQWVDGLHELYPHVDTKKLEKRSNLHVGFHLYDFLLLFGPVISWWAFPFERMIGTLQKINTNNHIGGELEATIARSYVKGATLRRWLSRKDCPEIIHALKDLLKKALKSTQRQLSVDLELQSSDSSDRAHFTFKGVNYSRAQTHLGNSLVLFYPSLSDTTPVAGSIQRIEVQGGQPFFHIRRQEPLPSHQFDPFRRYPWFFAKTYSSKMSFLPDVRVPASSVLSHAARFNFSYDRAVILNLSRD